MKPMVKITKNVSKPLFGVLNNLILDFQWMSAVINNTMLSMIMYSIFIQFSYDNGYINICVLTENFKYTG